MQLRASIASDPSTCPPRTDADIVDERGHVVQFYEDDAFLIDTATRFIGAGLGAGDAVIVIATRDHLRQFEKRLRARGLDVANARASSRYVPLDAAETLSKFMLDGRPDRTRFEQVVGGVIAEAGSGRHLRVRAFGEMVALLWTEGQRDAAVRLEELWNDLAKQLPFSLLCAYPLPGFGREVDAMPFGAICGTHSRVLPAESYAAIATTDERLRVIAQFQQKASALEAEVAERKRAERSVLAQAEDLATFIEQATIAIHSVGPDGIILAANPAELALLGYSQEEYVGHHIAEFHADQPVIDDILKRLTNGETLRDYAARLRCKDGSIKDVLLDSNVHWEDGQFVHTRCFTRDVTSRKREEEALARLAAIVESSDDAIVAKSLDGIVTCWNRGAERLFGYTAAEMIGESIARIIPPDRRNDMRTVLDAIGRGQHVDHYATERIRKDGRRISVSLTVSPIRDTTGRIIGASKIARDVTEQMRAEAERKELLGIAEDARVEAESANRAKDEFLAMLGHELRTPLAAVRSAVVTAQLDASRRERAIAIARRQSEHLGRLLDDLLDVARITRGHIKLRQDDVFLATVVERAVEATRDLMDERGHTLSISLPSEEMLHVCGDAARLEQIVRNLLHNAAKYTEPNGSIAIAVARDGDDAVLRVRDNGIGIAAELLPRVFELYSQADAALDRARGGLGIGLAVVRRLVKLHGGQVEARSEGVGKGSEFVIRLPACKAREPQIEAPAVLMAAARARVLLVEDNSDAGDALCMLLELLGHEVEVVRDGPSALAAMRAKTPDVALIDIGLPGMDGYDVAKKARALPQGHMSILVALTGYARDEDKQRALAAGFDYHLTKPIEPDALQGIVGRLGSQDRRHPSTIH